MYYLQPRPFNDGNVTLTAEEAASVASNAAQNLIFLDTTERPEEHGLAFFGISGDAGKTWSCVQVLEQTNPASAQSAALAALEEIRQAGWNTEPTAAWMQQVAASVLSSCPHPGPQRAFLEKHTPEVPAELAALRKLRAACAFIPCTWVPGPVADALETLAELDEQTKDGDH